MSTRRPRIKASANLALASKRKPKNNPEKPLDKPKDKPSEVNDKPENNLDKIEETRDKHPTENCQNVAEDSNRAELETNHSESSAASDKFQVISEPDNLQTATTEIPQSTSAIDSDKFDNQNDQLPNPFSNDEPSLEPPSPSESPQITDKSSGKILQSFEDAFKYPQNPDYKRPLANVPLVEDTNTSDFEDNILHMDLQKSPGFPMSPTKARQRIRPTPIFGQRRNSFVLTSPSPHTEEETTTGPTRQRSSNSTSSDISSNFLMRKLAAGSLGRIRTESGCSTVSESRGSSRKNPNDDQNKSMKKEFQMRFNGGVPDKSTLKMFDLIYYNPSTNPMEKRPPGAAATTEQVTEKSPDEPEPKGPALNNSAMPVPQLKLGLNGELMIDEMSLEIETTAEVEARKVLANASLIYHDENTAGEGFYKRTKRTKDWQHDETIKFYRCLQTVGTDFSLMLTLFPNRTRRDLKLKFKKEERCNLNLINKALLYPGTFNIEDLKEQLDAEEEERQVQERLWKEIKSKEAKKTKKITNPIVSSSSRILTSGEEVYQNENITKDKLSKRPRKEKKDKETDSEPKVKKPRKRNKKSDALIKTEDINLNNEMEELLNDSEAGTMDSIPESEGLNEASINLILSELANGTLALVSSEDETNPNKTTINEIYIMCKETNTLSDRPLDLPEDIVDAIKAAISS